MINFDAVIKELSVVHDAVSNSSIKREILGEPLTDDDLSVIPFLRRYEPQLEYSPVAKLSRFISSRNDYLHDTEPSLAMSKLLELASQILVADVTTLLRYFRKVARDITAALDAGAHEGHVMAHHLSTCATIMNEAHDAQYRNVIGTPLLNFGSDTEIDRNADDNVEAAESNRGPIVGYFLDDYEEDNAEHDVEDVDEEDDID